MIKMKFNKIILTIFFLLSLCFVSGALSDNNEAYYTLDNKLTDETGNGNTLTNHGASYTSAGKINGAYDFTNGYMESTDFLTNNDIYSINFWIKLTDVTTTQRIFNGREMGGSYAPFDIYVSNGKVSESRYDGSHYQTITSSSSISINTWYMITMVYSGSNKYMYIDNSLEASTTSDTFVGVASSQTSYLIGVYSNGVQPTLGLIDEISFWDGRAITSDEIEYLYASSNPSTPQQYPYTVLSCDTLADRLANGCINFENNVIIQTIATLSNTKTIELNNDKIATLYRSGSNTNLKICDLNASNCDTPKLISTDTIVRDFDMFEDLTNNNIIISLDKFSSALYYVTDLDGNIITEKQYSSSGSVTISSVQTSTTDFTIAFNEDGIFKIISCKLDGSSCTSARTIGYPSGASSLLEQIKLIKTSDNKLTTCYSDYASSSTICYEMPLDGSTSGTSHTINSNTSAYIDMIEGSDSKLKIVYQDEGNSDYGTFISCDLDGDNCGSEIVFQESTSKFNSINEFNSTLFISTYNSSIYNINLAGSTISLPTLFTNETGNYLDSIITTRNKILISYNDNSNIQIAVSEELGIPTPNNRSIEQTYIDLQISTITLTGTAYTTILSGSFNITQDNVKNYGSSTLQVLSDADNEITCRTNLDNVNGSEVTRNNDNGIITSMNIFRGDSTILTGTHNITMECKKVGIGNIYIGRAVGVGHLLISKNNNIINNQYNNIINTITTGAFYDTIGNTTITTNSTKIGFNKYLVVDWGSEITNQDTATDDSSMQIKIYNEDNLTSQIKTCQEFKYDIPTTETINIGSACYVEVDPIETYVIEYLGTGTDLDYNINSHVKILDLKSTEILEITLTDDSNTATTFTEIATLSIVNELSDISLYIKASANIESNTGSNTIAHFKLKIEGDHTYESQDIPHTAQTTDSDFISEGSIPIPTGNINVKILAYCENNDCIITRGEILTYLTEQNQLLQKEFNVYAHNNWNKTTINNFNVYTSSTFYNTTTGDITIPTNQNFIDFSVSDGEGYIPISIANHDTLTNYNASLYQSIVVLDSKEIYTDNSINNFEIETEQGTFSTTNGLITIYPNLGNYLFNFTFDTYYNKNDVDVNITTTAHSLTLTNVYDIILEFENSIGETIYPSCNWLGNVFNESYLISSQLSPSSLINCSLLGYLPYITNFSGTFPKTEPIQMNASKIVVNLFDRSSGDVLLVNTTVTLENISSTTTTNGTAIFLNDNINPGGYTVSAVADGYYTEQKTFTFNNEEIATISLKLLATETNNTASLYVSILDEFTHVLPNTNVKLESYNSEIEGFEEESQAITNSNGECQFLVEVGTKKYRIYASKVINGILQEQYSTPVGEYFQPDLFNGEFVYKELVRQIVLSTTKKLEVPQFIDLQIDVPDNEAETIQFQNESTFITYIPIEFTSLNNLDYKICLEYYVKINGRLTPSLTPICLESSSGQVPTYNFSLTRDFTNVAKVTIEQNNQKITYKTYTYPGNDSLWYLLNKNNYVSAFILIFWIALLSFSLYSKNIPIFCYGADILAIFQAGAFPSVINISGSIMIILISSGVLYLVRKPQDNI